MNKVVSLHQKKGMPEYGVTVYVHGSACWGDWKVEAQLKPYKGMPYKKAPPHRFVNNKGEQIKHVEFWTEK